MNRLESLNKQFAPSLSAKKKMQPTDDVWMSMGLDEHLRPHVVEKRKAIKKMMEENRDRINENWNKAEMAHWIIPMIKELGINGAQIKDFGGPGFTNLEFGSFACEMAKVDASLATFHLVHNCIGQMVIEALGDE